MRHRYLIALTAVAALALPGSASAKPDRTATLSAASPNFSWSPPPTSGSYLTFAPLIEFDPNACSKDADTYCDQTLVNVDAAPGTTAKLDVMVDGFDLPNDFDLYLYKSDATGKIGEEVEGSGGSSTGNPTPDPEHLVVDELEPGYYVILVAYFYAENATFNGVAKVTGAVPNPGGPSTTPPPPSGGGTTSPPPSSGTTVSTLPFRAAATIGSARKAKRRRAFSFKVTADDAITNLKVRLAIPKGATIGTASLKSLPKGTRTLKLKVAKKHARKLKAGKYQLVATGVSGGRTKSVSQIVTVKK